MYECVSAEVGRNMASIPLGPTQKSWSLICPYKLGWLRLDEQADIFTLGRSMTTQAARSHRWAPHQPRCSTQTGHPPRGVHEPTLVGPSIASMMVFICVPFPMFSPGLDRPELLRNGSPGRPSCAIGCFARGRRTPAPSKTPGAERERSHGVAGAGGSRLSDAATGLVAFELRQHEEEQECEIPNMFSQMNLVYR